LIYKQVKNTENDMLMAIIDELMYKKTNAFLEDKYVEIGEISKLDTLNEYKNLKKWINTNLSEKYTEVLSSNINTAIENNAVGNYKTILWASGWNIEVSPTEIQNTFLSDITSATRCNILKKLPFDTQTELIKIYFERFRYKGIFDLLHQYLTAINKTVSISFKSNYLNTAYWDDKEGKDLLVFVQNYLAIHCTEQENFDLFFDDFSDVLSKNLAIQNLETLSNSKLEKVLKHKDCGAILAFDLLLKKVYTAKYTDYETVLNWAKTYLKDTQKTKINDYIFNLLCEKIAQPDVNYRSVLNLCKAHFSDSQCYKIDVFISETCDANEYLRLWEDGVGKIMPKKQILVLMNDDTKIYEKLQRWIAKDLLTTEQVTDMMLDELAKDTPVTDRMIFYRFYNAIRFLSTLNIDTISRINSLNNDFYTIILWFLDHSIPFNFDLLKQKFIYFNPEDQVVIVRKLFGLIHKKELNIGIEKLNELTRIDLDLYRTNLQFNPQIPLDISTDVVLKALLSYKQTGRFLVDSDLLTVVLANLYDRNVNNTQTKVYNKEQEFKLETYFEACEGRLTPKHNWENTSGYITKVPFTKPNGEHSFYFAIHLSTGEEKELRQWNERERCVEYKTVFIDNPKFEEHKDAIKQITGRKWDNDRQHWGVPVQYEQEVLVFAKKYRFRLNFEGNDWQNNLHLVEYNREEKPTVFCDGRKSNTPHREKLREFWWCKNAACFENCQTFHTAEEWKSYTMLDFVTILGFDTDEGSNIVGDFVSYGKYYHFVGLINRFNRLLERLYCKDKDCNKMLYPTDASHFGRYRTLRFQCQNECCANREIIYLNRCLNWKCDSIIDSRKSKKCNYENNAMTGLYICNECGGCCSHRMLSRRIENLKQFGGDIRNDLIYKVEQKLGHSERAEYFCYECATPMREFQTDRFKCDNVGCDVRYDTTPYKIKRPHRNLVEKKKEE
jgi:hypothetical protein